MTVPAALAALALALAAGTPDFAPVEPLHPRALSWLAELAAGEPEAARAREWSSGIEATLFALRLEPGCEALLIAAPGARPLPLSPALAAALLALSRHGEAVERSAREPVPHERVLEALSRDGTGAMLRAVFVRAREGPLVFDRSLGRETPFEPGGIAYLEEHEDGPRLVLVPVEDKVHDLARRLLAARERPIELARLAGAEPLRLLAIDPQGLLRAALERYPAVEPPDDKTRRGLALVLNALGANVADSYGLEESTLVRAVVAHRPRGRYLGLWHGHPGERGGDPPSDEDRRVARMTGRFLTVVELPAAVDVWDLTRDDPGPKPFRVAG